MESLLLNLVVCGAILAGHAHVIDGDTIRVITPVASYKVRLAGIDAPELKQECARGRVYYRCGETAKSFLEGVINDGRVVCEITDSDRYGRFIGYCFAENRLVDINRTMVEYGQALVYLPAKKYNYYAAESRAQVAHIGIWRSEFEKPWEYRRRVRTR